MRITMILAATTLLLSACGNSNNQTSKGVSLKDEGGRPWVVNIEKLTLNNTNYRTTKWTGKNLQMTVMTIPPGGDIGLEVHKHNDQFIRLESGKARIVMGRKKNLLTYKKTVSDDWAIFIPAGYWHNIINTGRRPLKVYVLYAPVEHKKGTVHRTKKDDTHH